jgi:hypothetical protein
MGRAEAPGRARLASLQVEVGLQSNATVPDRVFRNGAARYFKGEPVARALCSKSKMMDDERLCWSESTGSTQFDAAVS